MLYLIPMSGLTYVAMLLMKSPMRTMTTQQLPYNVKMTQTVVTHLPMLPVAFSAITMYGARHYKHLSLL